MTSPIHPTTQQTHMRLFLHLCLLLLLTSLLSGCLLESTTPVSTPAIASASAVASVEPAQVETPTVAPTLEPVATATTPALPTPTTDAGKPLLGRRVALDPGHGPRKDMGAVLVNEDTGKLILA